jgi:hypothetical protein
VNAKIQEALAFVGLTTEPDFRTAGTDDFLTFLLVSVPHAAEAPPDTANPRPEAALQDPAVLHADVPSENEKAISDAAEIDAQLETNPDDYLEPEEEEDLPANKADQHPASIQPDVRPVTSQAADWTISLLRQKMDKKQLDLRPKYQREYVWKLKPELPSRLVESVLLDVDGSSTRKGAGGG